MTTLIGPRWRRATARAVRARYPDAEGFVERDGVRIFYEVYGEGEPTILLLPTWSIVHSRDLEGADPLPRAPLPGRHVRRPRATGAPTARPDAECVPGATSSPPTRWRCIDATGTERGDRWSALSCGALWATLLAADHPERVDGVVYIGPAVGLAPRPPERGVYAVRRASSTPTRAGRSTTATTGAATTAASSSSSSRRCFTEPHSTKQIEDCIGWALETDARGARRHDARRSDVPRVESVRARRCARVRCPVLVIHGDDDLIRPHARARALAEATGGELVTLEGVRAPAPGARPGAR